MFVNDYILRMIEDMGRMLRQVILQEEEDMLEIIDEDGTFSDSDFFGYRVGRLLAQRQINEAENLLFEEIGRDPQPAYIAVALHFYEDLQDLTDEELEEADFSREEIAEGLEAPRRLCAEPFMEETLNMQEASSDMETKPSVPAPARPPVSIAIDGPSGAGKSTIARILAKRLGFLYVDTGALYRAVGFYVCSKGADPSKADEVEPLLDTLQVELRHEEGEQRVYVNGEDVGGAIRTPEISMAASAVSALPAVRRFLFHIQQDTAARQNVIMDGRDIGTVVLPHAQLKIFLTASAEDRAARRTEELREKGIETSFDEVLADMKQRDYNDENRAEAPLRAAEDAVRVDTTGNTLEQSVAVLEKLVRDTIG